MSTTLSMLQQDLTTSKGTKELCKDIDTLTSLPTFYIYKGAQPSKEKNRCKIQDGGNLTAHFSCSNMSQVQV